MYTVVYNESDTRKYVMQGIDMLYDAVKETYGPTSGNIGIVRLMSGLSSTHDGVTVANSITPKGPALAGAQVIDRVTKKMEKENKDGTSTVTILCKWIVTSVQDRLLVGESPIKIRDELNKEAEIAIKAVDGLAQKLETVEQLRQVAGVAASDDELGKKIADIVFAIGESGSVTIEYSTKNEDSGKIIPGFTIDNGIVSNYMLKDVDTLSTTLKTPHIIVANKKFETLEHIVPIITSKVQGPILVIGNDFSEDIIRKVIDINEAGMKDISLVKSPRFGHKRKQFLEDIAAVVGTTVVEKDSDFSTTLGSASQVIIDQDKTVIIGGNGTVEDRKKELTAALKLETNEFEKEELRSRISAIEGKAAIFYVGGYSEEEAQERRDRVQDAIGACQAALRGGFVAGGGTTPLQLATELPEGSVLEKALAKPFDILLENIGLDPKEYAHEPGWGVNLRTGEFVDLFEAGIIEPAETIKKAIEGAVSSAGNAITMKRLVYEEEDDE